MPSTTTNQPSDPTKLLTIDQAHEQLELPTTSGVLRRWCNVGIKVGEQRIRLRHKWIGARLYTSAAWMAEFHTALDEARTEHAATAEARREAYRVARRTGRPSGRPRKVDPNVRQKRIDAAMKRIKTI